MSVNKLLTLTAVGVASLGVAAAALAGGPEYAPAPSYAGIYLEGNVGYAARNWLKSAPTPFGISNLSNVSGGGIASTSNLRGGFTGGVDVGYQFNQYFAVEAGWMYLPRAKATFNTSDATFNAVNSQSVATPFTASVNSGLAYGAFKMSAPVYENTYIFGKLGAGYVYNRAKGLPAGVTFSSTNGSAGVTRSSYWNPLWAAGVQYYFNPSLSVNFQYMNIAGYSKASSKNFAAPSTNLFTVGVGYKFLM